MQLNNEFMVAAPADETWRLLTDLERIAPCMPGAALTGRDGEDYLGAVKIKVGPIGAHFNGRARFVDQDHAAHTATISLAGKDTKGAASANATLRARLEPVSPTSTRVYVDTDLDISGKMAQFGRGAIADVSARLLTQFTDNLGALIATPGGEAGAVAAPPAADTRGALAAAGPVAPARAGAEGVPSELNALDLLVRPALKQVAVPLACVLLGWLIARAFPRRPR